MANEEENIITNAIGIVLPKCSVCTNLLKKNIIMMLE